MDLGQVFTKEIIADYMVDLFSNKVNKILDPCFGDGVFVQACLKAGYKEIIGCEIDKDLHKNALERYKDVPLYCMDFFKFHTNELFDGIIMNPPYIRHEKINSMKTLGITKSVLRKDKLLNKLPSTANLYMYFVIRAIELLKDNGELVVIFPSSWLDAKSGKGFKTLLESLVYIEEKIFVSGKVFEEDALVDVVILKAVKKPCSVPTANTIHLEYRDGKLYKQQIISNSIDLGYTVNFNDIASVRRGLSTGWNKMFINPEGFYNPKLISDILSSPKAVNGFTTHNADVDKILLIPKGYSLSKEEKHKISELKKELSLNKSPKALYEKSIVDKEWYVLNPIDSNGILFGYIIRNDMRFILNDGAYLARDNFYIIKPVCSEYIMLALLNNYYTYYQLETLGKKYGAGILKLQRYDIEKLSFININEIGDDVQKLEKLGKELCQHSNEETIEEITRIIAEHTKVSYSEIMKHYHTKKAERLENNYGN